MAVGPGSEEVEVEGGLQKKYKKNKGRGNSLSLVAVLGFFLCDRGGSSVMRKSNGSPVAA